MSKLTLKLLQITVVIPLILSLTFYYYSAHSYDGTLKTNRFPNKTITIERDEFGIPKITGSTLTECFYGLGFAHAQDRLWNMYLKKMFLNGRLSELFGPDALDMDKSLRTLSLIRTSEINLKYMKSNDLEKLQAYTNGVNDYAQSLNLLPFEFYLLGAKFENFTVVEGIALQKILAFALSFDWSYELLRERLAEVVGRKWADEMLPHRTDKMYGNISTIMNDDDLKKMGLFKLYNDTEDIPLKQDPFAKVDIKYRDAIPEPERKLPLSFYDILIPDYPKGSNSWVVSGKLTASGKPILVNDPHLDNNMPAYWYQTQLVFDGNFISGISFPGLPTMCMGRTKYFSWGFTAAYSDVADLYNETISKDNKEYFYDGQWYPLEHYDEKIYIKGRDEPYIHSVDFTRHGPIMDLVFAEMHIGRGGPKYTPHNYSLAWVGYLQNDTTFEGHFKLGDAKTVDDIVNAVSYFIIPPNSLSFATEAGDIGWISMGRIPKRANPKLSAYIKDGTDKNNDWLGFIPWSEHPKIINPEKGYIGTANNKISSDNIIHRPSLNQWSTPRANRIEEMILNFKNSNHKITVEDMRKMLLDQVDVYARAITPTILSLFERHWDEFKHILQPFNEVTLCQEMKVHPWTHPLHPKTKTLNVTKLNISVENCKPTVSIAKVVNQLVGWNGDHSVDSVPAAIYSVWEYFYFLKSLKGLGLNEHERQAIISNIVFEQFIFNKLTHWEKARANADEFWCKDSDSLKDTNNISFYEARDYLANLFGNDIKEWKWGKIHRMDFKNIPFSETPLKPIWHRSYEAGGNTRTINVASHYLEQHNFDGIHGPNLRLIVDMNNQSFILTSIDTGLSDRVLSSHFQDQMELHRKGEFIPVPIGDGKKQYTSKFVLE